jgi:hypothetical protein
MYRKKTGLFYFSLVAFPAFWWFFFLYSPSLQHTEFPQAPELHELVQKNDLRLALQGNFQSMHKCLISYHKRYQQFKAFDLNVVQPFNLNLINRIINYRSEPNSSKPKFIAQTFISATIGLAIAEPEQIIAIPEAIRKQTHLHNAEVMEQVLYNSSRYNAETLFSLKPNYCFVASYTSPTTLGTLKMQDINLIFLDDINSTQGIIRTLLHMGTIIEQVNRSTLLSEFTEATWCAFKNEIIYLKKTNPNLFKRRIAFLFHYDHLTFPSNLYLAHTWLEEVQVNLIEPKSTSNIRSWTTPIQIQELPNLDLEALIIACTVPLASYNKLISHKGFKELIEKPHFNLYFINDQAIHSPTQLISLGFYDLLSCINDMNKKSL